MRGGSTESILFVAKSGRGAMKVEGAMLTLAPDKGSDPLLNGIFAQYDGLSHSVRLLVDADARVGCQCAGPKLHRIVRQPLFHLCPDRIAQGVGIRSAIRAHDQCHRPRSPLPAIRLAR